jgi:predicted DNA-binding transcriptional regulator YafY
MMALVTLIQAERGWNSGRLAKRFGVKPRTIYRDLRDLRAAGVDIDSNDQAVDARDRGYRFRPSALMQPVQLTLEESLALISLAQIEGIPLSEAAERAVVKVRSQLPSATRDLLHDLDEHIRVRVTQTGPHDGIHDVYRKVRDAIATRRALRCEYESAYAAADGAWRGPFLLRPYSLLFCKRAWYVIGRHDGHGQVRTFKLNRFSGMAATDQPYAIPDDFTLETHLGNAWTLMRGSPRYRVSLLFDPSFAENIAETQWHHTQHFTPQADGSVLFQCSVDGLEEIVWWVLSMGPHCRVLKPTALAHMVREHAHRMWALYARTSSAELVEV